MDGKHCGLTSLKLTKSAQRLPGLGAGPSHGVSLVPSLQGLATWPAYRRVRTLEALYQGSTVPRIYGQPPRVAVVGAGLAGLVAAHLLSQGGCRPDVYEASTVLGGRVRTDHGQLAPDIVTELGGEFIDSTHADMIALARVFGLSPIDLASRSEAQLQVCTRMGGVSYTAEQLREAFAPFAGRIRADAARLSPRISRRRHTEADRALDGLSIDDYLDGLGMDGWLRRCIGVGYTTLHGLDSAEQSSVNLLTLIDTAAGSAFSLSRGSDERWKVAEGMDRLVQGLARGLPTPVQLEHRLVRVRRTAAALQLDFETSGRVMTVKADAVILALPFTLLREVECPEMFSPDKRRAIDQLAYGTNTKLIVGLDRRVWREQGCTGDLCTDGPLQTGWDGSRLRAGEQGVYTFFLGGRAGRDMPSVQEQAQRLSKEAAQVWPGFQQALTGRVQRVHWASEPWAQGSYSTYRTGQRTTLAGDEALPQGGVFFAGEHCSRAWQGYMQGAASTGREAALAILRQAAHGAR
ncbi:NAD(P)/FAD-dependent oxidoreductase [Roseateles puraquae]|uniref:flavin monoamine oxidase family protein n=1 Tax=Roseateles puraquae TaxID=431059 RepID=UPI0031E4429D